MNPGTWYNYSNWIDKKIFIYHKRYNKSVISTAWLTWKVCYIGICDIKSDERQFGYNHLYICCKQNPYSPFQSVVLTVQVEITFMYPVPLSFKRTKCNPSWISNYIHYKAWYVITYPFPNFNDASVWGMDNLMAYRKTEVTPVRYQWGYSSPALSHTTLYWACDYSSILGLKLNRVSEKRPLDFFRFFKIYFAYTCWPFDIIINGQWQLIELNGSR